MSGSMSRRKGATYQREAVKHLQAWAEQHEGEAPQPKIWNKNRDGWDGDDALIQVWTCSGGFLAVELSVELKNCRTMDLAGWLAQAKANAGPGELPVVIHKKRGTTDVGEHYVTMTVDTLLEILGRF